MRPFFCYYGGKWRSAPHYPTPQHDVVVEPFAGAAGYATRHHERKIVLVEADPVLAALWRYLVAVKPSEVTRLKVGINHVDELGIVPVEAKYLVGFWMNKGASTPSLRPSAWMRSGIRPRSYWGDEVRSIIAGQVEKIRHWKVIDGDATTVAPDIEATWFIDPPYCSSAGRHYRVNDIDYMALSRWCRSRAGQVIVCEHAGATWLPFRPFRSTKASPGKQKKSIESDEMVWTNAGSQ